MTVMITFASKLRSIFHAIDGSVYGQSCPKTLETGWYVFLTSLASSAELSGE